MNQLSVLAALVRGIEWIVYESYERRGVGNGTLTRGTTRGVGTLPSYGTALGKRGTGPALESGEVRVKVNLRKKLYGPRT